MNAIQKTMLVVDDEETLRDVIAFDFKRRGFEVYTARNGQEAYEIVKEKRIDIVVTDVRMPGGDGIQLLDDIKRHNPFIPVVIFITGFADMSIEEAFARGASQVFSKPFNRQELFSTVEKFLSASTVKWKRAHERVNVDVSVQLSLSSLTKSVEARALNIGQGGMFIALSERFPEVLTEIGFMIRFESGDPLTHLEGEGIVRWVRRTNEGDHPSGVGVEFKSLAPLTIKQLTEFIERAKMRAFIPKT